MFNNHRLLCLVIATCAVAACSGGGGSGQSSDNSNINSAPIAANDNMTVNGDTGIRLDVLRNDRDPDGDTVWLISAALPEHGSVLVDDNGTPDVAIDDTVFYQPVPGFVGNDRFSYTISDGRNGRASGNVSLTINDAGDAVARDPVGRPRALADNTMTSVNTAVLVDVLANDSDPDSEPLNIVLVTQPVNGDATINDGGTPGDTTDDFVLYVPNAGYSGYDSFLYRISDGTQHDDAVVNVAVAGPAITAGVSVSGSVFKGPVNGARVSLYAMDSAGAPLPNPVAQTTTDDQGRFSVLLNTHDEHLLVVSEGGFFIDEIDSNPVPADRLTVVLADGETLSAVLPAGENYVAVNVFTNALLLKAIHDGGTFANAFNSNRVAWQNAFGFDLVATPPADPTDVDTAAPEIAKRYAMTLGGAAGALNQIASLFDRPAMDYAMIRGLIEDLAECRLDGIGFDGPVQVNVGGPRFLPTNLRLNSEILRFRNNHFDQYAAVTLVEVNETTCATLPPPVSDSTAPVLDGLPANLGLYATATSGIPITDPQIDAFLGAVTAIDDIDGVMSVTATLPGGTPLPTMLPLGTSMVTFSATDSAGNTTTANRSITVSANADLSLLATATDLVPGVATTVGFDITVSNAGPQNAAGVTMHIGLGGDFAYLGDDSGGSYNPATGAWTIPDVTAGAAATIHIDARVIAGTDHSVVAELLASSIVDPDSTPADGGGDDYATVALNPIPLLVNAGDASIDEGNAGTRDLPMPVALSHAAEIDVSINYSTIDLAASAADDYTATSGTLIIPAGMTIGYIPVTIIGDAVVEPDEQFSLVLGTPSSGTLGVAAASGTILNDDGLSLRIDDVSTLETDSGAQTVYLTITGSAVSATDVSLDYATADNSATAADGDYLPVSGTATIPAGSLTTTIAVIVNGDTTAENNEQLIVELTDTTLGVIADTSAVVSITNDDNADISIADVSIPEPDSGVSGAFLSISLSQAADRDIDIHYVTTDDTAQLSDSDYLSSAGTLTIPAGFLGTTLAIGVSGDQKYEGDEQFTVTLSAPSFGSLLDADAIVTITNNDPVPVVSIAAGSVRERDAGTTIAQLNASLNVVSGIDVNVDYATADGSATLADNDYLAASGTVVVPAGTLSATVYLPVLGDTVLEPDETVAVTLSSPVNATLGSSSALLTVFNDDIFPLASVADATITESDGVQTLNFPVSLSNLSASDVIIDFATVDGTAVAGADYTASTGSITIAAGTSSGSISIPILGDIVFETDETFAVRLTGVTGGAIADPDAVGSILNDDSTPELKVNDSAMLEGNSNSNMSFVITLSNPSASDITFDYTTTDQTAIAGSDFVAVSGSAIMPAGTTSITIDVPVIGDLLTEPDESFLLQTSNTIGAVATQPDGLGSLANDDSPPQLSVANASEFENDVGSSPLLFTVSLSAAAGIDITVNYATRNDTATAGSDYVATAGTLTITAGMTSAIISVDVIGDVTLEADETFFVDLSGVTNATLDSPNAIGTIVDEESRGVFVWIGGDPADPDDWHNPANWAGGVVPGTGDNIAIPLQPNQPIVSAPLASIHDLVMAPGAVLSIGTQALVVRGALQASNITGSAPIFFLPGGTAPVSGTLDVPQLLIGRRSRLSGPLDVSGSVTVGDHLDLEANAMHVAGSLTITDGHLHMEDAASVLDVDGDLVFDTETDSRLTAGVIHVGGNFSQLDDDSQFSPSPTHTTIFDGPDGGLQVINIVSPGTSSDNSSFGALVFATNGDINLRRSTFATGVLTVPATHTPRIFRAGANRRLVSTGVDIDGLVLDNIRFRVDGDPIIRFDNVSFINQPGTVDQLVIRSADANVVFNQIDFQTMSETASGDYLIDARDTDNGTPARVVINNSAPLLLHGLPWSNTDGVFDLVWGSVTDDSDGDGVPDATEFINGTDPLSVPFLDSDGDGIDDVSEIALGSNPFDPDTDGDGIPDGVEVATGSDPLTPTVANVYYIDPAAALPRDGLSWDTAASDYANLVALLGGPVPAGLDSANPTYVLIADTRTTPIVALEWQVSLSGACDNIVFQGSLSNGIPAPTVVADKPVSVFGINAAGQRIVDISDCENVQFRNISFTGGNGVSPGGAIRIAGPASTVLVHGSYFNGNSSTRFGGAIGTTGGSGTKPLLIVENSLFDNNSVNNTSGSSPAGGGAIYAGNDTALEIYSSQFNDNTVSVTGSPARVGGAGVYLNGVAGAIIANSEFINNQTTRDGAALLVDGIFIPTDVLVRDSRFEFNRASRDGGAILVTANATLNIADSTLFANFSGRGVNGGGGAINLAPGSTGMLNSLTISGNTASDDGGGILVSGSATNATIMNSVFSGNFASDKGGALSLEDTDASVVVHNNLFTSNYSGGRGGALRIRNGAGTEVSSSTFAYNRSAGTGAAAAGDGTGAVIDCVMWNNRSSNNTLVNAPSAGDSRSNMPGDFNMMETDVLGINDIDLGLLGRTPDFEAGFYLQQSISLGIDSGSTTAALAALDGRTTAVDGSPDAGVVDRGFHYFDQSEGPAVSAVLTDPETGSLAPLTFNALVSVEIRNAAGDSVGNAQDVWVRLVSAPPGSFLNTLNGIEPAGPDSAVATDLGDGRYGVPLTAGPSTGAITFEIWVNGANLGNVVVNVL